ncbi:chloramphenicol acetyltransferase [Acanthocystis turfacea Chlorella virus Canal-1]|nr:chloramphenicol acetyltransferase [Acanthocystis turfacea Chlorella virus Canal-1]
MTSWNSRGMKPQVPRFTAHSKYIIFPRIVPSGDRESVMLESLHHSHTWYFNVYQKRQYKCISTFSIKTSYVIFVKYIVKMCTHIANMDPREYVSNTSHMSYGTPHVLDNSTGAKLHWGSFCSVADGVKIYLGGHHRTDYMSTYPFGAINTHIFGVGGYNIHPNKGDVHIGSDVWIGADVSIMANVKIGHGAVVGCNAVVTKDVKPYSIVAGNPAKFVRYRFSEEVINELLDIAWWDLPIPLVKQIVPFLMNENVSYNIPHVKDIIAEYWATVNEI